MCAHCSAMCGLNLYQSYQNAKYDMKFSDIWQFSLEAGKCCFCLFSEMSVCLLAIHKLHMERFI